MATIMDTIEEVREQAREALNSAAVARRYSVHPDAGTLERALRALLDATEPSTVAVKTEFRVLDASKECDYHEGFEEGVKVGRAGSGPRPITDEMVKAGADEFERVWNENLDMFDPEMHDEITYIRTAMRAALEAAEAARR